MKNTFRPACLYVHRQTPQIKTATKVNRERRLSFVGTGEAMACVVAVMKQGPSFQQLLLLWFFNNVALYML